MSIDTSSIYSTTSTSGTVETKNNSTELSMTDFFELMVAQLKNQSMLDPVDNSEFIGQMAQFSTLSQIQELSGTSQLSYAVSLLGKNVTAYSVDDSGNASSASGTVTNVLLQENIPYVEIDGAMYAASDVVLVTNPDS